MDRTRRLAVSLSLNLALVAVQIVLRRRRPLDGSGRRCRAQPRRRRCPVALPGGRAVGPAAAQPVAVLRQPSSHDPRRPGQRLPGGRGDLGHRRRQCRAARPPRAGSGRDNGVGGRLRPGRERASAPSFCGTAPATSTCGPRSCTWPATPSPRWPSWPPVAVLLVAPAATWLDPAAALVVTAIILVQASRVVGGSVAVLLESTPPDLDPAAVCYGHGRGAGREPGARPARLELVQRRPGALGPCGGGRPPLPRGGSGRRGTGQAGGRRTVRHRPRHPRARMRALRGERGRALPDDAGAGRRPRAAAVAPGPDTSVPTGSDRARLLADPVRTAARTRRSPE